MNRQLTRSGAASNYFNSRADTYELGPGSWHAELARDFLVWAPISAGQRVLDLPCGTGLVSIPAAVAAGPRGEVIGVDISSSMLQVARQKPVPPGSAPIEWCEADIADLGRLSSVQTTVAEGGFDLITCCSSFVYLADRAGAIRHWFGLLKEGGRLIVDAPTEEGTLQYVSATSFRDITGIGVPADRGWVKGMQSLEELFTDAGFSIERSVQTKSYRPERWIDKEELEGIFEEQLQKVDDQGAKEQWRRSFESLMEETNGQLKDAYAVYVTIGRK